MKKLFAILICAIMCVTLLASCDEMPSEEECVHTKVWQHDENGHWESEQCNLNKEHIYGPSKKDEHVDANYDGVCDVCGREEEYVFVLNYDKTGYKLSDIGPAYKGGDVVIPSTYRGLPVVELEMYAFGNCKDNLTSVTIPGSVKEIGMKAFAKQDNLETVIINGSTIIDVQAFYLCPKLKTVVINEGTEYIYAGAFSMCFSLESVTIADTVTKILGDVFANCTKLKTITIPASVEIIGGGCFVGSGFTDIYFEMSAPGEAWDENWDEGLYKDEKIGRDEDVNLHWAVANSGTVQLRDILQKLSYGYNVDGLIEKYNFYEGQGYYLVDNAEDYCELLSDVGVPYEGPFDALFEENVMICYLRCVSGSADFIPVDYFYSFDTNEIECKTSYQPEPGMEFPAVEICWCVDLVEVPKTIFEKMLENTTG